MVQRSVPQVAQTYALIAAQPWDLTSIVYTRLQSTAQAVIDHALHAGEAMHVTDPVTQTHLFGHAGVRFCTWWSTTLQPS